MHWAVELFFDDAADAAVRAVWQGIEPDYLTLMGAKPHITLSVLTAIEEEPLLAALETFAGRQAKVELALSFVGSFATEEGVVFLGPAPSTALIDLHRAFHESCGPHFTDRSHYYRPGTWVPHCTVAWGLRRSDVGAVMEQCRTAPLPIQATAHRVGLVEIPDIGTVPKQAKLRHHPPFAFEG